MSLAAAAAAAAAALTVVAGAAPEPRLLPALCDGCLREPLETDYFEVGDSLEPPRVNWADLADRGRAAFAEAVHLGKVLIIENASLGTALGGWSCAQLAKEFPDAKMRREYDWVTNPEDQNLQSMGLEDWIQKTVSGEDSRERLSQDAKAPPYAPFYWGVREHRNGQVGSKQVVKRVRELIVASVPAFMDEKNGESMFDNAEFWLGAKGTGARAHMDSHCIPTLSTVLSGERRWRVGPAPRMPRGAGRSKDGDVFFDDGVAYALHWKPMFEFTVKAGEAVLFPPGWIHETLNSDAGCTVALTTQFTIPKPVGYWRNYYDRLRRIGDLNPCWKEMRSYGSLGKSKQKLPTGAAELRSHAEKLLRDRNGHFSATEIAFYDVDRDGAVSQAEFLEGFVAWGLTEQAIKREKATQRLKPDMSYDMPGSGRAQEL